MTVSRSGGVTLNPPWAGSSLFGIGASSHFNGYAAFPPPPAVQTVYGVPRSGGLMASGRGGGSAKTSYPIVPPSIHNLNPPAGSQVYKNTLIEFDVTDGYPIVLTEIQVTQGAAREVVYDGTSFVAPYQGSQQTVIGGGNHYVIIRYGGWVASPVFYVIALDVNFNQGTLGP